MVLQGMLCRGDVLTSKRWTFRRGGRKAIDPKCPKLRRILTTPRDNVCTPPIFFRKMWGEGAILFEELLEERLSPPFPPMFMIGRGLSGCLHSGWVSGCPPPPPQPPPPHQIDEAWHDLAPHVVEEKRHWSIDCLSAPCNCDPNCDPSSLHYAPSCCWVAASSLTCYVRSCTGFMGRSLWL